MIRREGIVVKTISIRSADTRRRRRQFMLLLLAALLLGIFLLPAPASLLQPLVAQTGATADVS